MKKEANKKKKILKSLVAIVIVLALLFGVALFMLMIITEQI